MAKEKTQKKNKEESKTTAAVGTRGHVFEGTVTKKFAKRVVVEAERTIYHHKFERYFKKMMRLHARLPEDMDVNVGDYVRVRESRPLSKIINFVVIGIVRKTEQAKEEKK
jgi:small subunit ribosomal protein S17